MGFKHNILVLGSGGREHSIIKKIKESEYVNNIFAFPGNGGISVDAVIPEMEYSMENIKRFSLEKNIDTIIVGPEAYIVEGIKDYFNDEKNIFVFAPDKRGSELEGSKVYAKKFMNKYNIPTAGFEIFDDFNKALDYVRKNNNVVVKADGLAAGKGVYVCSNYNECETAVKEIMLDKKFNEAGNKIVIEDKLVGEEASILIMVGGNSYSFLIPSQDHKPIFDGDKGPNTGGMGAYAPTNLVDSALLEKINNKIVKKVINGLSEENIHYTGIIYIGLMIVDKEPYVLEFNVRFGDPETEAVLPMMKSDLLEKILLIKENQSFDFDWKDGYCVDVVLASKGYPGSYEKGKEIFIGEDIPNDIIIAHSGTTFRDGKFYTNGGRVLNIAAIDKDIVSARTKVYDALKYISFDGMYFRTDIGLKEEKRIK